MAAAARPPPMQTRESETAGQFLWLSANELPGLSDTKLKNSRWLMITATSPSEPNAVFL